MDIGALGRLVRSANRIDLHRNLVDHAATLDQDSSVVAIYDKRHGQDRVERVALGAAVGRDRGFAAGNSDREIRHRLDRGHRDARTIVGEGDPVVVGGDLDFRRAKRIAT